MIRKLVPLFAVAMLAVGAVAVQVSPASAGVDFAKGTLTITGNDGVDVWDVDCGAGFVTASGTTDVGCSKVKHLVVNGGGGNDDIDLGLMFSGDFVNLVDTTVHAGPGHDEINGSFADDSVFGEGGIDRLNHASGSDEFAGGPGSDTFGSAACDCNMTLNDGTLTYSNGNEISLSSVYQIYLTGGVSANNINIGQWNGRSGIFAGGGNDIITGGSGTDDISPSSGQDVVTGGAGDDIISAEESVNSGDTFAGGPGDDRIWAGTISAANSTLTDTQLTGFGTDTLSGFERAHLDRSAAGTTDAFQFSGDVQLGGTAGNDSLYGGFGDDILEPGQGVDNVDGGPGTDHIDATTGVGSSLTNALLTSTTGNKTIQEIESARIVGSNGTAGVFNVSAFSGPVVIYDSGGNDVISGNGQTHFFAGTLTPGISFSAPTLATNGRTMSLTNVSSMEFELSSGGIVNLSTFPGDLTIWGSIGADEISTGPGADLIAGYDGNDKILAGDGKDKLYGMAGRDNLNGQGGRDGCNGAPGRGKLVSCEVAIKPLPEK